MTPSFISCYMMIRYKCDFLSFSSNKLKFFRSYTRFYYTSQDKTFCREKRQNLIGMAKIIVNILSDKNFFPRRSFQILQYLEVQWEPNITASIKFLED